MDEAVREATAAHTLAEPPRGCDRPGHQRRRQEAGHDDVPRGRVVPQLGLAQHRQLGAPPRDSSTTSTAHVRIRLLEVRIVIWRS
jgi:hypothetical protein